MTQSHMITSIEALEALYGQPSGAALAKETTHLTEEYRRWVEKAPFMAIASCGPRGLDCSPRGDETGQLLKVIDDHTLVLPDRGGNKRLDTMRNILEDPRVSLLFLIPGITEAMRIRGEARISVAPELLGLFEGANKPPVSVLVVTITSVFFQCARALMRSRLWQADAQLAPGDVPSAGEMIRGASPGFDAGAYDQALPERQKNSL
ncbi:MAG: hypothetical protein C0605_07580 [Hyphomicrobiales bacterium]|nr:MAG: hypothetical protein C0605_07580 [Hyphomicrobiales bacterium]